jgi:hypothetical protein
MAKKIQRKRPGYTRSGEVKIISLSVVQLTALLARTQAKKTQAKIQRRIDCLQTRPGHRSPEMQHTLVEQT